MSPQAAEQTAAAPTAPAAKNSTDETAMMLGGGALALLALGGAAVGMRRRRHDEGEVMVDETYEPHAAVAEEPAVEVAPQHDPIFEEEPAIVAPSAFAWGNSQPAAVSEDDDGSDRRPGESWVERAYRGPSPANPSVSLRARLKRAAFFDKRERDVAAGTAEPVETDAGLPDTMVEEQERELETA